MEDKLQDKGISMAFDTQLAILAAKTERLLAKPAHVLIDPALATDTSGRYLPTALRETLSQVRTLTGLVIELPERSVWNTSDLGPGISRSELCELTHDIATARRAIST